MKKADLFFNVLRLPVDFGALILAGLTTYILRTQILSAFRPVLFEFNLPLTKYLYLVFFVSLLFIGTFAISGLYSMRLRIRPTEEFLRIGIASSAGIMIVIIYIFLRQELFNSRFLILGAWLLAILFVFLGRILVKHLQTLAVAKYDFGVHKLAVVGDNDASRRIINQIKDNPAIGYRIVRHFHTISMSDIESSILGLGVDELILAKWDYEQDDLNALIDFCHENHIIFKFVPGISEIFSSNYEMDIFAGSPIVEIRRTNLEGWGRVIKRVVDFILSLLGLIILMPLFGIVAFAIKWETEGPVLVRLRRVSKNKEFNLYKFRSMIENAHELSDYLRKMFNDRTDGGPLWKMKNDPRITKVGRIIRKFRIDELPQLLNVMKGDISLVGPRPHQPDEVKKYEKHHKKVLAIKAGVTGLAQVSGSSDLSFEREVSLDSFYIDNWSLWLDIKIIIKTAIRIFFDRSAV